MENKGIYIGEVIKFGWKTMKDNLGFFIGLLLVSLLVGIVPLGISSFIIFSEGPIFIVVILYLLFFIFSIIVSMGLIKVSLKFCDNEKGSIGDLFSSFPLFFKYLLSLILYILIVFAGAILLVFPAVIWGIKFSLFPYFIVEKGAGPLEALQLSSKTTMGAKWDLLGFQYVLIPAY